MMCSNILRGDVNLNNAFLRACSDNDLKCLKEFGYSDQYRYVCVSAVTFRQGFIAAATGGYIGVLRLLWEQVRDSQQLLDDRTLVKALVASFRTHKKKVVDYMVCEVCRHLSDVRGIAADAFRTACGDGDLATVKFLQAEFLFTRESKMAGVDARLRHIDYDGVSDAVADVEQRKKTCPTIVWLEKAIAEMS